MKSRNRCKTTEAMKAVVYCRVSTKEQVKNLSLGIQETQGLEYCRKNGWEVARIFRDEGASAKTTDRAEFQRMLDFCKEARNGIGYVVVNDLSRFSRYAHDQFSVMADLNANGINLRSVTEDINETPTGKMLSGLKAVMNQHENDVKAERTKLGMRKAASMGNFPFKRHLDIGMSEPRTGRTLSLTSNAHLSSNKPSSFSRPGRRRWYKFSKPSEMLG